MTGEETFQSPKLKANVRLPPRIIPAGVRVHRPGRHVSVKDVAALSGVSFQTTSKVLNGGGSVSDVTRARIQQAAADLGYVPNLQARSLVMQKTQTVGVITSDFRDHDLSRLIGGAEQEARRQGYGVMIASIEPEGSGTEYALPAMMERRVDGILLAAPRMEEDMAVGHVLDHTMPVVSLHHVASSAVTTVGPDDEDAGYLATRHLLDLGHTVIAVVGCDDLDAAAFTNPPLTSVHIPFYETGAEAMRVLLSMVGGASVKRREVHLPVHLVTRGSTARVS